MMQPHVREILRGDRAQHFGHAVNEWFDADEADLRMHLRLAQQMFTPAEADFEAYLVDGARKQRSKPVRHYGKIERQPRQQGFE